MNADRIHSDNSFRSDNSFHRGNNLHSGSDSPYLVVVRGAGDLATGTIWCLHQCGFRVLATEVPKPSAIRRSVAFSEAMYDGAAVVENVTARRVENLEAAEMVWRQKEVPILADPALEQALQAKPEVLVDAAIAKRNLGTRKDMAPLVIALGPGFTAGEDADIVIETNRGHNLGRMIFEGSAQPNTGVPGVIAGYGKERVIHSPGEGIFLPIAKIGDIVEKGDLIAHVGRTPVYASISGLVRGILREGYEVTEHFKIADIDPRIEQKANCYTISDKARTIAGGVLTAICMRQAQLATDPLHQTQYFRG